MKRGTQAKIAKLAGLSETYISLILSGQKQVTSWPTAKRLAAATSTTPELWLEGTPDEIKAELQRVFDDRRTGEDRRQHTRRECDLEVAA